jgi:hypothetical protein
MLIEVYLKQRIVHLSNCSHVKVVGIHTSFKSSAHGYRESSEAW